MLIVWLQCVLGSLSGVANVLMYTLGKNCLYLSFKRPNSGNVSIRLLNVQHAWLGNIKSDASNASKDILSIISMGR